MAFSVPAMINGQPKLEACSNAPTSRGGTAAARLRVTLVSAAAATRYSGGTIAIT